MEDSIQERHPQKSCSSDSENDLKETSSVGEFLKQSSQIQTEIKKLSEICSLLSPKQDALYIQPDRREKSLDSSGFNEDSAMQWGYLNEMLAKHSLKSIPVFLNEQMEETPDLASLYEVMFDLLLDYTAQKRIISDLEAQLRRCTHEEPPRKHSRTANNRTIRSKKAIFKSFLHRDLDPQSPSDAGILRLIKHYEAEKSAFFSEFTSLKNEVESQAVSFKQQLSLQNEPDEILSQLTTQLSLNSCSELSAALHKMQKALQTLPPIEKFLSVLCRLTSTSPPDLEQILAKIRDYKDYKGKYLSLLRLLDSDEEHAELKAKALARFCRLFEASASTLPAVIDQLYYFVHELKLFLSVSPT